MKHFHSFINWVLPITCVLCGQTTHAQQPNACPACIADLPWIQQACQRCGLPLTTSPTTGMICGECMQHPPIYQRLHALFHYEFPVDQLILRLKFQQRLLFAHFLGVLLAQRFAQYYTTGIPLPAMLIPMPLHSRRLRQRGFNQACELARPISKQLQIPLGLSCVKRIKYTSAQMELPLQERASNVKNAFAVIKPQHLPAHVAIIDDVVTSGHTIQELAAVLQEAGGQQIDVWCIARAFRI